jgi:ribosomal protein S18 acetylase RimI-like enzyme
MEGALPHGFGIRPFTMADYVAVVALWRESIPGVGLGPSDAPEQIEAKLARDPDLFLVVCRGDTVIGAVMGGWDGRRAYVYHLAVDERHRRRGVAAALLDELETRLRAKGALKVKCQIFADNAASLAFFRRRGYEIEPGLYPVGKLLAADGAPPPGRPE